VDRRTTDETLDDPEIPPLRDSKVKPRTRSAIVVADPGLSTPFDLVTPDFRPGSDANATNGSVPFAVPPTTVSSTLPVSILEKYGRFNLFSYVMD
jgi:hypothetical protein